MGRGKVELKRIENKINRQVTFTKRRNGLLKKAHELSVLCDVEVAAIIFSSRDRLFQFCSSSSMIKIIERYRRCTYKALEPTFSSNDTQKNYQECVKLKAKVEYLQHSQNNLLGEDLGSLSVKELEELENQIEMSLKKIRSAGTQVMLDQLCDLNQREQVLQEANKNLKRKLQEAGSSAASEPPQAQGFSQPLGYDSPLQIGLSCIFGSSSTAPANKEAAKDNGFIPGWI